MTIIIAGLIAGIIGYKLGDFLAWRKIGQIFPEPTSEQLNNEASPIFDSMVRDFPQTHLDLINNLKVEKL